MELHRGPPKTSKLPQGIQSPEGVDLIPSRDGRIRTGDPLNPIRLPDGLNHGKKRRKSLVGRTICNTCSMPMLTSAALNRHMNRPNRHMNRHKSTPARWVTILAGNRIAERGTLEA